MSANIMIDIGSMLFTLLYSMKDSMAIILAIGAILTAIQCFFGYRIFRFWIGVQGFILFWIIGTAVGYLSFKGEMELYLFMGLVLGFLGALIAMELYRIGVFLQCFWTGSLIGVLIGMIGQLEMEQTADLAIISGIAIGIIGVILIKPLIMLSTGFSGGMTLGCIVAFVSDQDIFAGASVGIIVSILGVLYQSYSDEQPPNITSALDDNAPNNNTS